MHSPLPARSRNSAGCLLIAAVSGRALAAAARRAGYRPLVADFFLDTDTVALAERTARLPGDLRSGIEGERLVGTLRELAADDPLEGAVLGSGFERHPDIVDVVARHFPLAGNRGAAIRGVKDPQSLAAACAALDIPHPAFRLEPPPDPGNWVVKTAGAAGGTHVGRVNGEPPSPGRYFQRLVRGRSVSALFVGDGRAARIVGFSRQWTSPSATAPYRYGGAVRLTRFDRRDAATIGAWLSALTRRAGLLGLCSADFVRNGEGYRLIEVNPRPGATLDIFDDAEAPLMGAHLRASRGEPFDVPRLAGSMASMVTYAAAPIARFPAVAWPDWTADRQSPGTALISGDPVCTVFARGPTAAATRKVLRAQADELRRSWEGART